MNGGQTEREKMITDLADKLQRVHAGHIAKLAELRVQQVQLLKEVMARLDREQAQKILSSIKGGSLDTH